MKIKIQKLFNGNGIETGVIVSPLMSGPTSKSEKEYIEIVLKDYERKNIYPDQYTFNYFPDENSDTPSVIVIKNINDIPIEQDVIDIS
jgi:hypothetical protein